MQVTRTGLVADNADVHPASAAADQRIGAVLFDFDGTLYTQGPLRIAMACELAVVCAMTAASGGARVPRVLATFRRLREQLRDRTDAAGSFRRRQYAVVAERLHCTEADVERIVNEWMHRRPLKWLSWCRRPGVVDVLRLLAARGLRAGVLSDYPARDKLAALGLDGHFDLILSAEDAAIDALKPDPRGYLAAAAHWNLPPSRVLYIGDRLDVDAAGARAAGMPCIVVTREPGGAADARTVPDFRELRHVIEQLC